MDNTSPKHLVGWVLESPGRGSLAIILSCLTTIFLCTWVVLHSRVYKHSSLHGLHKITLFFKAIVAPEFIAVEGLQEWSQARRMVKDCEMLTGGSLKLIHAFYIGMLALRYSTPRGERVIWPNQFIWLLEQDLIKWEDRVRWGLSEEVIRDKSNADGTAKLIALCQVSWFVAQCIMRRAHNLPLAQLETMTLSYIPLIALTYFFWWVKPKDVMIPSVVNLPEMSQDMKSIFESMAVSSAFDNEGLGKQETLATIWYLTPRVFEKEIEDKKLEEASRRQYQTVEPKSHQVAPRQHLQEGRQADYCDVEGAQSLARSQSIHLSPSEKVSTKERVVACWDPELYHNKFLWPITCLFGASFGALHLISWYTTFPTPIEQWLWRAAGLVSAVSMLIFMQFERVVLRWGGPLTVISLVSPVLYLLSRLVMMGGVIAAFRASDPAIYNTYTVSTYWIHIL
ncbi:hypothetical protein ACLMJK_006303 [Lecanora helva]